MAQEKGFVNEVLEAVLTIELMNGAQIECVLDTGFYGNLLLPRKFVEENSLLITGTETVVMIEENSAEISTAKAEVRWLGDEFSLPILVSETGESLIGTEMLIDTILEIDYINSTVKITKPK